MSIWRDTEIEITGSKELLEDIYNAIVICNDPPLVLEDDSANNWCGNILKRLHINTKKYCECAFWSNPRFNKYGHLVFDETSRNERTYVANALLDKYFPEISGVNYTKTNY